MNTLSKIKKTLNEVNEELSSKLLFYDEFIDINSYKIEIINSIENKNMEVDCSNNIIYIDEDTVSFSSFKSQLKHKLLHAYLYNITDIELKRLSLDTSYLFILYCLATDTEVDYTVKNTFYYNLALEVKSLIKKEPRLVDLLYISVNKEERNIVNNLNKLAESEWIRINMLDYLFDKEYKDNVIEIAKLVNNIISLIYQSNFFNLKPNLSSNIFIKENA